MLSKTEIGLVVSRLRKHEDQDVVLRSKEVVKKWKADVDAEKKKETKSLESPVEEEPPKTAEIIYEGIKLTGITKNRTMKLDGVQMRSTGDLVRDKSAEMIYTGLATSTDVEANVALGKAIQIEREVNAIAKAESAMYKEKIRSLFHNLKDASNPNLKLRVLSGSLAVKEFCRMSADEMKSKERIEEEERIRAQNIFNARGAQPQESETDQFKCGKCKQRKARYYQMQTRSADEPMTTFVTCTNCGNKWKFC